MTRAIGKGGMALVAVIAATMCVVAFFLGMQPADATHTGICLPSPDQWPLLPWAGWTINTVLIAATAIMLAIVIKGYNIVQDAGYVPPAVFLISTLSVPGIAAGLTSSAIMAPAMLLCLTILFSTFRSRNATQELFVVATILSIGSMFQYGFIFMIVPIVMSAIAFKCFRIKEGIAFVLGLVAPYWVAIGLGLVPLENFTLPHPANAFTDFAPSPMIFVVCINLAVTALATLLIGLNNLIRLYAGNSRRRLFNVAFNLTGIAALACIIFDYSNSWTYLTLFYLCCAVQSANFFSLWHMRRPWISATAICMIYMAFFVATILSK